MTKKINSLQYLRAIAAILVVYTHCLSFVGSGKSFQASFYHLKSFGAIGVDIFFVISGFIISYVSVTMNGVQDALTFIKKRFVRINPNYYIASLLALILRLISKPNESLPIDEIWMSIAIVPLFIPETGIWKPVLYVGWTLAYEWLFYFVFAILISVSIRQKRLLLIIIFFITSLAGVFLPFANIQYNFIANPLVLEFCLGVFIASLLIKTGGKINIYYPVFSIVTGLIWYVMIIIYGYGFYDATPTSLNLINYWNRFFVWGVPSAMIVFGMIFLEQQGKISCENKIFLLLGDASFSIYLIHTIFISFLNKFFNYVKFIPLDILVICAVVMGTIISVTYYKLVEVSLLQYFNSIFFKKQKKIITNTI